MGTETCRRRECAHRYSSLPCLQAVFHLGKRGALSRWEFKAFSIVRCQQPCSGMTAAAATVCEHKSAGFSPSQHPAGTLPNSLPNYKKITYGTKAAVCPHYVRYYHAHDCHGLRSSQATTTNCPPTLKRCKALPFAQRAISGTRAYRSLSSLRETPPLFPSTTTASCLAAATGISCPTPSPNMTALQTRLERQQQNLRTALKMSREKKYPSPNKQRKDTHSQVTPISTLH